MLSVFLAVGAFLVALIGITKDYRIKEARHGLIGLTRSGRFLLGLAALLMVGGIAKEWSNVAEAAGMRTSIDSLSKKNDQLLKTLGKVEAEVSKQVAYLQRQAKIDPITTDPQIAAVAQKLKAVQLNMGEIQSGQATSQEALPGETMIEASIVGPTGPDEYTLEARVTPKSSKTANIEGAVAFFVNGQELRLRAPLQGGKARLPKVELEKGTNRMAAQFVPSVPTALGSRSPLIEFEVK